MESRSPQRTCVGCRRKDDQDHLLRIGRNKDRELVLTEGKERIGRGAYVCPQTACIDLTLKAERLSRALRAPVTVEEKNRLHEELICKLR
jgi:predicted RNA-binding protein YlxR (DUF448 family)